VDDAETNATEASLYNAKAPGILAAACQRAGVHLFHFSSDYVYDNELRRPLVEEDSLSPKSIYAVSKLDGENAVRNAGPHHTILRTSWVYGHGGHNFVNTMIWLGQSKTSIKVVGDQIGAPTYTYDIVEAVKELIHLKVIGRQAEMEGTFNFSNAGEVTWDEFARTIFRHTGSTCEVETITTKAYGAVAPRPAYSVLNCNKISKLLKQPIPPWEDALMRYLVSN
jgi:dTDP-4-dehydrorhamnose reductase